VIQPFLHLLFEGVEHTQVNASSHIESVRSGDGIELRLRTPVVVEGRECGEWLVDLHRAIREAVKSEVDEAIANQARPAALDKIP
jgi:hypothetical protein